WSKLPLRSSNQIAQKAHVSIGSYVVLHVSIARPSVSLLSWIMPQPCAIGAVVPSTGSPESLSPAAAAAEQPHGSAAWWRRRYLLSSMMAAGIGLSLSIAAWYAVTLREDRLAEAELRSRAANHASLIENGIKQYIDKVVALRALFESDDHVARTEFQI